MSGEIAKIYGNRVRVRACGMCWSDDRLLLVNHRSLSNSNFWAPPGGGVEFGERLEIALKREFKEETGLEIGQPDFAFGCEFIEDPLHAVELFFSVLQTGGTLKTGYDPELQLIQDVRFLSDAEIRRIPADQLHGIFRVVRGTNDLRQLRGFYTL